MITGYSAVYQSSTQQYKTAVANTVKPLIASAMLL